MTCAYACGVTAVQANIRGGGEYGPRWHQAALKEKRNKSFEDFEAVGQDLIARGVTSAAKLGCEGGSNGGLLTGNMLVRSPELFGAVVCQVPLLDMRRYHKLLAGASWMEEYGNPDAPGVWEGHLASISPYERLRGAPCLGTDGAGAGTLRQASGTQPAALCTQTRIMCMPPAKHNVHSACNPVHPACKPMSTMSMSMFMSMSMSMSMCQAPRGRAARACSSPRAPRTTACTPATHARWSR